MNLNLLELFNNPINKYNSERTLFLQGCSHADEPFTFLVTNLNDDGPGTLRRAIERSRIDGDIINIEISGTIKLKSDLPELSNSIIINGNNNEITIDGDEKVATGLKIICKFGCKITNFKKLVILNAEKGLHLENTQNIELLTNIECTNNKMGLCIENSHNNIFSGLFMNNNATKGISISNSSNNIFRSTLSCKFNGSGLCIEDSYEHYFEGQVDLKSNNYSGLLINNANKIFFKKSLKTSGNNKNGIKILKSYKIFIDCSLSSAFNYYGIYINESKNIRLKGIGEINLEKSENVIINNHIGILIKNSSQIILTNLLPINNTNSQMVQKPITINPPTITNIVADDGIILIEGEFNDDNKLLQEIKIQLFLKNKLSVTILETIITTDTQGKATFLETFDMPPPLKKDSLKFYSILATASSIDSTSPDLIGDTTLYVPFIPNKFQF